MNQNTIKIEDDPKEKILIVEDEDSMRMALSNKLTAEGYHVFVAQNGKEGLEIALKEHPNLMLVDIVMPVMDGMTMMKELRNDKWGKDAKAIILTNLSDAEKTAEAVDRGVYDILVKSDWKLEDVIDKIKDELNT
ncbi:response regulator [Patescibacteria group bacterium]|nr:response regulator [Patescibacteria group bacterium]